MTRSAGETASPRLINVLRVTSGNFLEFFDFFLYGFYAKPIAATFFPAESEFASIMLALVVFGVGFLVRPIGAIILGNYVDRVGRRKGLILSLSFMAVGTVLIAFVPGYAVIGPLAPTLVVLGRLLQGLSAGGEPGSVAVYLAEIAPPGHRGLYVAGQSCSQQVATIAAGLGAFAVNASMTPDAVAAWGWRIPFFVGCLIIPILFMLRRSLQETAVFAARTYHPSSREVLQSLGEHWRLILGGTSLVIMTTVSFYLITTYTPTFGERELHLSRSASLIVTCCIGLSNLIWLPIVGALSDRIGRKAILIAATVTTLLTAYPAMSWLVMSPSMGRMLAVELWLSFLYATYNGAMTVALTELVPAHVRVSGFALAYSLATTLGGFSLAISTLLIAWTGDKAAPGLWMSLAAICGLSATLLLYRGVPMGAHSEGEFWRRSAPAPRTAGSAGALLRP